MASEVRIGAVADIDYDCFVSDIGTVTRNDGSVVGFMLISRHRDGSPDEPFCMVPVNAEQAAGLASGLTDVAGVISAGPVENG